MSTISTIIPTHNRVYLVRRALQSVALQTRPPDETIVVDDGSTDTTAEMIACEFPEVRCISQANAGVSAARNAGIAASRGGWIALLDSDDEWMPKKLELQMDAILKHPDLALCHTNEIWIRNGRRVNQGLRHAKSGGMIFEQCLALCAISPSSVMLTRNLFDEVGGFDESLPACEDYDLWLRICSEHPVLLVDEPLVTKYGGHDDQLSRKYWGIDRFRIQALTGIIDSNTLSDVHRTAAVAMLRSKLDVYLGGARKRGKHDEIARCEALLSLYKE